jgi:hypothetical protein
MDLFFCPDSQWTELGLAAKPISEAGGFLKSARLKDIPVSCDRLNIFPNFQVKLTAPRSWQ